MFELRIKILDQWFSYIILGYLEGLLTYKLLGLNPRVFDSVSL